MKGNTSYCDDRQLLKLVTDNWLGQEAVEMLDHLETCNYCQKRMEQLTADETHWHKAAEVLSSTDQVEYPNDDGFMSSVSLSRMSSRSFAWHDTIARQLLSPPSHPEMMGRLGRYEVERLIGSGGMGVVFKGHDTELNRPVAIKILSPYLSGSGPARQRFTREARAAAAVVNDHVVPIHNVETDRETPFLVMKYIAGESLQARIDREGAFEICEILRIGLQIALGLAAAHQQGLVHRDIKPPNILLEQGVERALITDFGLARAVDDASLTHTGFHAGTPLYMSPEQVAGEAIDSRSDLFSLGSVIYAMCSGRPPFRAENTLSVMKRIAEQHPRSLRETNPNIPEWLEAIVAKLLAKNANDRIQTAQETSEALAACLAHIQNPTSVKLPLQVKHWATDYRNSIHKSTASERDKKSLFDWHHFNVHEFHRSLIVAAGILLVALMIAVVLRMNPATIESLKGTTGEVKEERSGAPPADGSSRSEEVVKGNENSTKPLTESSIDWEAADRALQSLRNEADRIEVEVMNSMNVDFANEQR